MYVIRHRTNWLGKLVLQVQVEITTYNRTKGGMNSKVWRDAKTSDFNTIVVTE